MGTNIVAGKILQTVQFEANVWKRGLYTKLKSSKFYLVRKIRTLASEIQHLNFGTMDTQTVSDTYQKDIKQL